MKKKAQGEVIFRVTYQINATEDRPCPKPVVHILADREGLRWLAQEFNKMAEAKLTKAHLKVDPDDHHHINAVFHRAINKKLSHPLELRLGLLTKRTRARVLQMYGLEKPLPSDADMRSLFRRLITQSNKQIRGIKW